MLLQIPDLRITGQKPQQLMNNRFQVQLLGRDQGKAFIEREPHLMSEHRQRTRARAVAFFDPAAEDKFHQVEILAHLSEFDRRLEDGEVYRSEQLLAALFQPQKLPW